MLQRKSNIFILFTLCILSQIAFASWDNETFVENSKHQYWLGLSDFQKTELEAINQARENAINELVKYNFGFYREEIETFSHNLKNKDLFQEAVNKNKNVILKGTFIKNKRVVKKDGYYKAYVQISYSKSELELEKKRLSLEENSNKNKIKNFNNTNFYNFLINSNIDNVKITLFPKGIKNSKSFSSISGNPITLPSGDYLLIMEKNGYQTIQKNITLSPNKLSLYLKMEQENLKYSMNVHPQDSEVFVNQRKINPDSFGNNLKDIELDEPIRVTVKKKDYFKKEVYTTLRYLKNNILNITLIPKSTNYSFISQPEGASVYIDGDKIGTTPLLNFPTHKENFTISLVKKDYKMVNTIISSKEKTVLNFNLEKK